jgi:radical SAM protein with 4Fe4S-binding SPASM domain
MLGIDSVPYSPFKAKISANSYMIDNPISKIQMEIDPDCHQLLTLCDGYRTWGEIAMELARFKTTTSKEISLNYEDILKKLTEDGLIWWRKQRIQSWSLSPPSTVFFNITSRCNLRCKHCVVNACDSNDEETSLAEYSRISDEMFDYGVRDIVLSGGEPLIHKNFLEIAQYSKEKGFSLQISSNGTLINKNMAKILTELEVTLQVSLDGATSKVHDDFRQTPGSWKRAINGIKNLVEMGVPVVIGSTVTSLNISQIPLIYELAANLGTSAFRIIPFVPFGRGHANRDLEVTPLKMGELTEYLLKRKKEMGFPIQPMEFELTLSPPPDVETDPQSHIGCSGGIDYCTITQNEDVLPCHFFGGVEADNLREHSFSWIWENSRFLNYFRSLTVSDIKGHCSICNWLPVCSGSCRAANFANGDLFLSNDHCWLANP